MDSTDLWQVGLYKVIYYYLTRVTAKLLLSRLYGYQQGLGKVSSFSNNGETVPNVHHLLKRVKVPSFSTSATSMKRVKASNTAALIYQRSEHQSIGHLKHTSHYLYQSLDIFKVLYIKSKVLLHELSYVFLCVLY